MPPKKYKKVFTKKNIAMEKKMRKVAKQVYNANTEVKYHDRHDGSLPISDSPSLLNCSIIGQGTTDISRVGDKIVAVSAQLRYILRQPSSATQNTNCRIIYFQWFDFNNSPSYSDIISPIGVPNADNILSAQYNHDKKSQYRILYDKMIDLPPASQDNSVVNVVRTLKLREKKLEFLASGTAARWGIWCILISDYANAQPNKPLFTHTLRLNFRDA